MSLGMMNFKLKIKLAECSCDISAVDCEFREVKSCCMMTKIIASVQNMKTGVAAQNQDITFGV